MINTVVVIFATKIMNLFGNGCVHNVKKLIFLQKSLEFSIIKFIFAASFIRFQFSLLKSLSRGWCILHQPLFGIYTQLSQMGKLKNLKKLEKLKPNALQLNFQPKRLLAITSNDRRG